MLFKLIDTITKLTEKVDGLQVRHIKPDLRLQHQHRKQHAHWPRYENPYYVTYKVDDCHTFPMLRMDVMESFDYNLGMKSDHDAPN